MFEGITSTALLLYVTLLLVGLILLTLLVLLIHSGLFRTIGDVGAGKPPIGQVIIAYKFQRGPYNQAGQIFTEAAIIAPENRALGIYYDDPNTIESNKTRYVVGSILSEGSASVDEAMVKKFTENKFKILHLPEVEYVVQTKFPHITTLSILIAVHKVYPKLHEYIKEHKLSAYPFVEYYDGKTIHFLAPLSKQSDFLVPECEQAAGGDQATSDWDSTMLSTSQSSNEDSLLSQDITHTTLDSESAPENEQLDLTGSDSVVDCKNEDEDSEENRSGNNSGLTASGDREATEEEQVSDDSSSSFELLKNEHIE